MDSDTIRDNAERHRFEMTVDGHLARADYRIEDGVITLTHTIVPPALEGQGIASRLIRHALSEARARGLKVVPQCPFVAAYIRKHPEWEDLLAG
ncbi:GNAT family N-acetyltransferase [Sphingomonas sp. ST-64]|uniref:GNAT family N-acetyltransferase n=1 Tax=Sphingomonas plantiphila TaxID=3163295 RepID=A0ABW8YK61_9SPHN